MAFVYVSVSEMLLCSQFPTVEDFSLVVCHVCNKVVTPQGFLTHCGKKHTDAVTSQGTVAQESLRTEPHTSLRHTQRNSANMLLHKHKAIQINIYFIYICMHLFINLGFPSFKKSDICCYGDCTLQIAHCSLVGTLLSHYQALSLTLHVNKVLKT